MITVTTKLSSSRRYLCVNAHCGPLVRHSVPPFICQADNYGLRDWVMQPQYHYHLFVLVPCNVEEYVRYRTEVNAALRDVKAVVLTRVLKDHPLRAC